MDSEKREANTEEDYTKYGEFISSFYRWVPVEKQKEIAKNLDNITKDNEIKDIK